MSKREQYVSELMKYIPIDSYGRCLQNKFLPKNIHYDFSYNLYSPELLEFVSNYKFTLAIENGVCHDYITEKLWRPLMVGSVPIYFGSPTIKDWVPNNKSVIYIEDFESPKDLAKFLNNLQNNETEYSSYLDHKFNKKNPISNSNLRMNLLTRPKHRDLLEALLGFECFVCEYLYTRKPDETRQANLTHYDCPVRTPKMENLKSNIFDTIAKNEQCVAQVFKEVCEENVKTSAIEFQLMAEARINSKYNKNDRCEFIKDGE